MHIVHEHERNRFVASSEDGEFMGEIEYVPEAGTLTANHTLVDDAFQGKGVAKRLLDEMAAYARINGLKVIPVCSYVVAAFKKYPDEYGDIVVK